VPARLLCRSERGIEEVTSSVFRAGEEILKATNINVTSQPSDNGKRRPGWERRPVPTGRVPARSRGGAARVAVSGLLILALTACGGDESPEPADNAAEGVALSPVFRPADMPPEIDAIFPATGDRGRVLNHCSTCHAVSCAAIGRRTPDRWTAVEVSHQYYIPGLSIEDFGKIFTYLRRNFNDTLPEPTVPPALLEGGCPQLDSLSAPAKP
jgi:hypothetical protein